MFTRPTRRPQVVLGTAAAVLALSAALTGCQAPDGPAEATPGTSGASSSSSPSPTVPPVRVVTNVAADATSVPVSTELTVHAKGGTLKTVRVRGGGHDLPGELSADGRSWHAGDRLEPGTRYAVSSVALRSDGEVRRTRSTFRTQPLTLAEQTYPSVSPLQDETVGVGMPVIVTFDVAVRDKAAFERRMSVTSVPQQRGSWYWISDHEAHWRPAHYWKAGSDVHVDVDVNGVSAGGGIYGQESRVVDFHVGDAHIYKVNMETHQMRVLSNGKLLRTIPITTGKPGMDTRSGTKVIIEKFRTKRMNSETVGIPADSPEAYDIDDVEYAMRVTYSGEFVHAAPWSVGYQGYSNVSHGCTGMSTDNAGWLYAMSRRGDVVEYTGAGKPPMTLTNGYGDWNLSFADYREGSAVR